MKRKTDLGENFWTSKYDAENLGWDMGCVSPPIKAYIDQLNTKNLAILIPGAGNSYEAEYLFNKEFNNLKVLDLIEQPLKNLVARVPDFPKEQLILTDFFEHNGTYDLIIEQTFFCALEPVLREAYAKKMAKLLKPGGKLIGVLFDFPLTEKGPPFGGSHDEYIKLFSRYFKITCLERCYNSIKPRQGTELFIIFEKTN